MTEMRLLRLGLKESTHLVAKTSGGVLGTSEREEIIRDTGWWRRCAVREQQQDTFDFLLAPRVDF
jgi:hypothetical protein